MEKQSQEELKRLKDLVKLLDNKYEFMGIKFGLDPIIGLIPILGDLMPIVLSLYIIYLGYKFNLKGKAILKMIFITLFDVIIGSIPILGDLIDFTYHSHQKNFNIIKKQLKNGES